MSQLSPKEKEFTWKDLKRVVNRMPKKYLEKAVIIWAEDEKAYTISDVEILKEDYLFDGDEGCAPKSVLREADPKDFKENRGEYYLVHEKGTRIINA